MRRIKLSSIFFSCNWLFASSSGTTTVKPSFDAHFDTLFRRAAVPIIYAAYQGNLDTVMQLIDEGADVNARDETNGQTALITASQGCQFEIVELLLDHGAEVDAIDNDGTTALMEASYKGDIAIMRLLISKGAQINRKRSFGETALVYAYRGKSFEAMQMLLFENGAVADGRLLYQLLRLAVDRTKVGMVSFMITKLRADNLLTDALIRASREGHIGCLQALIAEGADVNHGMFRDSPVLAAAKENQWEAVSLLLETGADVQLDQVLILAARNGKVKVVRELLLRRIQAKSVINRSLHEASERGHIDCMEILIEFEADVNDLDCNRSTPLSIASKNGKAEAVRLLLQSGADMRLSQPLVQAAQEGHIEIVSLLLSHMERILLELEASDTAKFRVDVGIHDALNGATTRGRIECMRILIAFGADVNYTTSLGSVPILSAARRGDEQAVRLLLQHGARHLTAFSSAIQDAVYHRHFNVVRVLIENGALSLNGRPNQLFESEELVTMLILGGIDPALFSSGVLETYRRSITDPLDTIQRAVDDTTSIENSLEVYTQMVEPYLEAQELSPLQGLFSFIFGLYIKGYQMLALEESPIRRHVIHHFGWSEEQVYVVHVIHNQLRIIGCSPMNFTFSVFLSLELEDIQTLKRLSRALSILNPDSGNIFNQMVHRSSPVGFRPVIKALYSYYLELTAFTHGATSRLFPIEIYLRTGSFQDLEDILLKKLSVAIEKHYQA
jgi:ankyrin repeat protein